MPTAGLADGSDLDRGQLGLDGVQFLGGEAFQLLGFGPRTPTNSMINPAHMHQVIGMCARWNWFTRAM
ncbi:hypothetical protein Rhe02_32330 [Rhizocola hellebori]|uniref:Uncharacterized protein n=1 Tax=Rhizocola hellebori TaxID=1392758 RepID=A0A8J3Q8J5_9ACTN|nr:hypothetical protein Rhe02_32330 [Rhizocola hellebori]